MGFINYVIGATLIIVGMLLSLTILGAIIGIPMMIIGAYLLYNERNKSAQRVIRDGISEGLKKAKEMNETSTFPIVNQNNVKEDLKTVKETSETSASIPK